MYLMKHVCADDLLPLNKIMVFTVLEVSRQAILLSVVVVSAHRFKTALRLGHYVICGHYKRLIGCYVETTSLLVTIVIHLSCVEEVRGHGGEGSLLLRV